MTHRVWAMLFLGGSIVTAYQAAADERNFGEDAKFLATHQQARHRPSLVFDRAFFCLSQPFFDKNRVKERAPKKGEGPQKGLKKPPSL